jgi:hypothetical protein
MLSFVVDAYGEFAIEEAWEEFLCWPDDDIEPWLDSEHRALFLPWMLHLWAPDQHATQVPDKTLHDIPPTRAFLTRRGRQLDPITQRYLQACLAAPLAFHEIVSVQPGHGFRARELVFGREFEVLEKSASQTLRKGDILFSSLAAIDDIVMLEACPTTVLPPQYKLHLLDLRKKVAAGGALFGDQQLRDWDFELREVYFELAARVAHPALPRLQNTDGEPLSLQRLIFDIDSAQAAFDALKHLAIGETEDELLANAERTADGSLRQVELSWLKAGNRQHKSWNNTVLGSIEISAQRLSVSVNSDQRAARFRRIIAKAMGQRVRYLATELQSMEKALAESDASVRASKPSAEQQRLDNDPAVQALLREHLRKHYENWVNEKLPALNGKTPLQAARTAEGRERLEALIAQIEQDGARMNPALDAAIPRQLRVRLGLAVDR